MSSVAWKAIAMRKESPGTPVLVRAAARTPGVLPVATLALLFLPSVAEAHEGESDESAVLVEQAIALIANDADREQVAERIHDAMEAPHKEGVDLKLADQALDVVERPGPEEASFQEARRLLLRSLDGKLPSAPKAGKFVTGTDTGTSVVLDEFRPARGIADSGDAALFALALVAVAVGLWLSVRLRPRHSIRELERRAAAEDDGEGRKR
ncbi:hypothetical protein [Streptomyces sp. HUAS ZL42]|uniref:hypothetical protein n=1 Tax=Streptomyces sp. HUAS ZL42 TaxID=3231715 RepID=UPI00345E8DEA